MVPIDDELEEDRFRELLARHQEPTAVATPQYFVGQIHSRLPRQRPVELAAARRRILVWRTALSAFAGLLLLTLLGVGSWSVLVDSSLPLRLLADSSLGEALLLLALAAKPLLAVLGAQIGLFLGLWGALLFGIAAWWRLLRRVPAYATLRARP